MKDINQQLDQLFAKAKNEQALLSLEAVEKQIQSAQVPKSFISKYWPVYISAIALISAGLIYYNISQLKVKEITKIDLNKSFTESELNLQKEVTIPKTKYSPTQTEANPKIILTPRTNEIDKIKYLELNNQELKILGIDIKDDTLRVHDARKDNYVLWEVTQGSNSAIIYSENDDFEKKKFKQFRMRHITRKVDGELSKAVVILYSDSLNFDYLVPIKIVPDNKTSALEFFIWYDLTQEFVAALPARYQDELNAELSNNQIIIEESFTEQTNCGYLETFCRDISIFDRIRVLPNPATTHMSAHFETLQDCQLSIDLMDIEGRLVQNLFSGTISAGQQRIPLDVGEVDPDLYLLKFEASNGEYETMRVIIRR
ncbi:MAG: T9SS type A sorting domain-containing protein [Cyclobacteriaceae bacterium]